MLIGDPDAFAIWYDAVDSWSTARFKNGCFAYFIGGELLWSLNSTLGVDLNLLSGLNCIKGSVEDEKLFGLPTSVAYAELVARAFPATDSDAENSDYAHLVSTGSLLDAGFRVFLVELEDQAKLIWGSRQEVSTIREVVLKRGEFQKVVQYAIASFEA
ncbi:hypothetical protein FAZ69_32920 [Trinickia terrae]|uniref:Uncharacterized protein n=1 Tax=Trinickia terrae TaxID=2571161 RepID=A0A4U1HCY8_9BURK|nr:immunity 42 family protein [Trinickia terrae]TKC77197.1 hypothetical protein FAZ69_32920 [Trinickia terrae]